MPFLEQIARRYLESHGNELHEIAFVFPNHRACLYFNRHLARCKAPGSAIWAPQVYSIGDFILSLSPSVVPDPLDLIFQLYQLYQERIRQYPRNFEDFYPWGKMILADFNEIDKYLLDTRTLFRSLKAFKDLEEFNREDKAEIYNRYTSFWESLGELYQQFKTLLKNRSQAYEGMIYRAVAETIQQEEALPQLKAKKVVFCGLNALTRAEEVLIRHLLDEGRGEIYWDMDRYFVADENQEAGHFFRENQKRLDLHDPLWVEDRLSEERTISIIGVQSKVSQAKVLGLKLKELLENPYEPEQIAIVLPDETLLFPTLNSLPETIDKVNITIGFPLSQTPAYSLFSAVIEMQLQAQDQLLDPELGIQGFYHKDVQKVLSHPYIKPIAPDQINQVLANIKEKNRVYVNDDDLRALPTHLLEFFRPRQNSRQVIAFFLERMIFIRKFYEENQPDLFHIDYEYMYRFYTLLSRLNDSLDASALVLDIRTFRQLFADIVQNSRIPFTGEPLEGIQIMGMLETQAIDFKHLYILSVNEDHLPPGKAQQSFIPYSIRYQMKLPTYEDRDAIAAYHFYRLLKRAQSTTLIYTTAAKRIEKSEKSRFIDQLLIEFADKNPKTRVNHYIVDFQPANQPIHPISVTKSQEVLAKLAEKSYSASSLLNYLACSLKFYFTYVLRIREEEDVFESPDAKLMGTIIHETLNTLYLPYCGKSNPLTFKEIEHIKAGIEPVLKATYLKRLPIMDLETGRNKIIFEVMRKFLNRFFDAEKENAGFQILLLEKKIPPISFPFVLADQTYTVRLEGTVDRLDRTADDTLRIIDYKTGTTASLDLKPKPDQDLEDLLSGPNAADKKEAFQLLFYRYLLKRLGKYTGDFRLAIYPFKKNDNRLEFLKIEGSDIIDEAMVDRFEGILKSIFQGLFDPQVPFQQTLNEDTCRFCAYVNICSREAGQPFAV